MSGGSAPGDLTALEKLASSSIRHGIGIVPLSDRYNLCEKWDNKYCQREVDTGNPYYLNFALLLIGWEARAWDKQCREKFSGDRRSEEPYFIAEMTRMESVLSKAGWVIVESYEWESGLD